MWIIKVLKRIFISSVLIFVLLKAVYSQEPERPPVWGIAKITFLVSDFELARDYYGDFLGFEEAFSYPSKIGKVISFKINDRQFLEFVEDKNAKVKNRLVSVSFESDNINQMLEYLKYKGISVPEEVTVDGAGNSVFFVQDPSGIQLEYCQFNTNSLHSKSKGKNLSDKRISTRLHHVGLFTINIKENDKFYKEILGFREMWRYDENDEAKLNFIYLHIPDCVENIEYFVSEDQNVNHPCFLVNDMQEAIYTLKERQGENTLARPMIGKGNRWLLNMSNKDGTKVEFTEAYTVR